LNNYLEGIVIFRQLFDRESYSYSYLLADKESGEAALIDPVFENMAQYNSLIEQLGLSLRFAIDTHVHADHISALASLRQKYDCETVHGEHSLAMGITLRIKNNECLMLGKLRLKALYTPGHTSDSYCFLLTQTSCSMLFTGDTLLIGATGRTDFQSGSAAKQYQSLFSNILCLDDNTIIYPGHDYKGFTVSTIKEEKCFNPRLQVTSIAEYCALMDNLKLEKPKKMDIAIPVNLAGGR